MVIVDVVIIRTEEDINTSKGLNLLSGLQLQFGDPTLPTSSFSFSTNRIRAKQNPSNDVSSTTLTSLIGIPSVTYSLNIANANTARNEILARPSLVARHGVTSEFFSGVEIAAAAVSGGDGDSVSIEKEVGVKLAITPEFLDDGLFNLQVVAERTFLTTPSSSVVFDFRLDTSKTSVNANVVMRFGETLILGGLSEKETERNRDGVPLLQDIPLVQYLFSNAQTRDFRKSVLILITPRRPPYLYRSDAAKAAAEEKMSDEEKALAELEARYKDWFQPYPNWGSVFHQMQENQLYREFRTGDVAAEKWNSGQSHDDRLRRAKDFLFY
jgi:general secretion pathway protein D